MTVPLILLTNDDGIKSPGLMASAKAATGLGDIIVVAPSNQQTSMGRSLTCIENECLRHIEYTVEGKSIRAYHANGSPALLIMHALETVFANRKPDLLISGINYGENLGSNLTISGTLGAAIEGAVTGIKSMAVSMQTKIENHLVHADLDWTAGIHFTKLFAKKILTSKLPPDIDIININIPVTANKNTSWKTTKCSRLKYFSNKVRYPSPDSKIKDGICVIELNNEKLEPDSDIYAIINEHVVSVTPISTNLTSRTDFTNLNQIFF